MDIVKENRRMFGHIYKEATGKGAREKAEYTKLKNIEKNA